ncbi:Protein mmf1 [Penicillium angulare]|uniref:Protein mmf1 n=1 Tax=Penicillium angulare TaxID=116970 RepID=A0A9W9FY89_9EURO|nr:Protein mmf1 [Penicillium angulare]
MSAHMTPVTAKDACPPAGPYSQAIRANGQLFVSGQIPADSTGSLVQGNIGVLTQACCDNIKAIVTAAGSSVDKIVKVNVFLTDMANFAEMNATYEKFFVHKPARSCVAVHQLPKGVPVEIECIALE